jgi:hypothetical protein
MRDITYDELPDQIKAIIPRKNAAAIRGDATKIRILINFDQVWDVWLLRDGKWSYVNPSQFRKCRSYAE